MAVKKLEVKVREADGGVTILDIAGFVDRHTLDVLEKQLEELVQAGKYKLLVNCSDLTYISSNGIGVFIAHLRNVRDQGGDIRFCNMKDVGKTVITVLGLHNLFQIFDSEAEGIQSFGSK